MAGRVLSLLIVLLWATPACAQPAQPAQQSHDEVVVGTRAAPPFVVATGDGEFKGFSIDLWRAIAAKLELPSRFVLHDTLPSLLDAVKAGKQPVGISAISITAERAAMLDFSQPMFRAGLGIMVRSSDEHIDVFGILFSKTMLVLLAGLAALVLIPAHVFWWIARTRDEGIAIRKAYLPGIFDAVLWCAESLGGAPRDYPRSNIPRIIALVWLYTGILLVSYFTAYATTSLTRNMLRGHINGPSDLANKRVAVVEGSTGAEYIATSHARPVLYPDLQSCAAALLDRSVDAVVYDAPMIQYYALREARVQMTGHPFQAENYGIIFPLGSPLRRRVDEALLRLQENGTYAALVKKWMGKHDH